MMNTTRIRCGRSDTEHLSLIITHRHPQIAAEFGSCDGSQEAAVAFKFDAALVDGRFRTAAALKLLPLLHRRSVLIIHDFWPRASKYFEDLSPYYDVIGRTRSVVVLKLKPQLPRDWEARQYAFIHQPEPKSW